MPVQTLRGVCTKLIRSAKKRNSMSLAKRYMKAKPVCKVTFKVSKEAAADAKEAYLVGEFNNWDQTATPMKKLKSGEFSVTVDLEKGRDYEYKYLLDTTWENDWDADEYRPSGVSGENSVVVC